MMKKGFCRFAALCLCLVLCLSAVTPVFAATHITASSQIDGFTYSAAYGEKLNAIFQGKAQMFSNSSDTYSLGQNIKMNKQYAVAKVISGQQCYIYAQAVYHYLFGDVPYHGSGIGDYWNNSKRVIHNVTSVSRQSFIDAGVGFGAYIRTTANSNGSFSGSYGHSMILLGYDASGLTYLDCNGDGKGAIRVTTRTWSEFNSVLLSSKGRRIAHVVQPTNPMTGASADLGTGFTAVIQGNAAGKLLTHAWAAGETPQVQLVKETGSADQLWYFARQNDGSYKISSCHDGKYLETTGSALQANATAGGDGQKWYLYESGGSYILQSKLTGSVLTLTGSTVGVDDWKDAAAQSWSICRGGKYTLQKAVLSVDAADESSGVTFTWNNVYGAKKYNLRIWKGEAWTGEEFSSQWNAASGCTVDLPAGSYQAYVDTCHQYGVTYSNVVRFTVAEPPHEHENTAVVTDPSCDVPGYTTYTCTICGQESQADHTEALGHKYISVLTQEPTMEAEGILTGMCTRCDAASEMVLPMLNTVDYDYAVILEPTDMECGIARYTWKNACFGDYSFEVTLDKLSADVSVLPGDTNADGRVNSLDLIMLRQYLAGWEVSLDLSGADLNGNGDVNSQDLLMLRHILVA